MRTHAASSASIPALMGLLLSMTPSGLGADITLVPSGATVEIDAHDECRLVRNNNAAGLMVPHRFATEWVSGGASFLENTPANVVVSPCPAGSDNCEGTIQRAGFNPSSETQRQMSIAHVVAVGSTNGWCGGNENDNSTTYNIGDRTTWAEWSAKYPTSITDPTYNSIPLHSFVLQNACLDNHDLMNTYTSGYAFFVPDGCELSGGYWGSNPNFPCECEAALPEPVAMPAPVCGCYDASTYSCGNLNSYRALDSNENITPVQCDFDALGWDTIFTTPLGTGMNPGVLAPTLTQHCEERSREDFVTWVVGIYSITFPHMGFVFHETCGTYLDAIDAGIFLSDAPGFN